MIFSRQEHWSGLPFPPPGDLPNSGIEPSLPHYRQILYCLSQQGCLMSHKWLQFDLWVFQLIKIFYFSEFKVSVAWPVFFNFRFVKHDFFNISNTILTFIPKYYFFVMFFSLKKACKILSTLALQNLDSPWALITHSGFWTALHNNCKLCELSEIG